MAISLARPPRNLGMDQIESFRKPLSLSGRPNVPTTPGGYDSSGINPNNMYTGGVNPARPLDLTSGAMRTGGPLPATQMAANVTLPPGSPPQPVSRPMTTGGNLPPQQVPVGATSPVPGATGSFDINSILQGLWGPNQTQAQPNALLQSLWNANGGNAAQANPAALAQQYMSSLLDPNNPYIASARRHGVEQANGRGLLNSSIAAGTSQRAAIDAAMPMFQEAYGLNSQRENNKFQGALSRTQMGMELQRQRENNQFQKGVTNAQLGMNLLEQREGNAFQGEQAQRDRDLKTKLQSDAVFQQDWLTNQDFTRQFNAALSMIPIQTANQFMQNIQAYAIENPEIYTPEMINGMQNFFSQSMATLLAKYFPNTGGN